MVHGCVEQKNEKADISAETPILSTDRTRHNEKCPCGSGRNYKDCCLEIDERRANPKRLSQPGLMAIFRKMLKDREEPLKITWAELLQIPPDEGIIVNYNPEDDSFELHVVKVKKSPIIQPRKDIILN